ncbi:MAG TPA: hypothetical protein VEZ11_09195 [Thermoanaerobaculia bacterium]|nr:hypothetical protein [Thermoanaerobaculia bacterium]
MFSEDLFADALLSEDFESDELGVLAAGAEVEPDPVLPESDVELELDSVEDAGGFELLLA